MGIRSSCEFKIAVGALEAITGILIGIFPAQTIETIVRALCWTIEKLLYHAGISGLMNCTGTLTDPNIARIISTILPLGGLALAVYGLGKAGIALVTMLRTSRAQRTSSLSSSGIPAKDQNPLVGDSSHSIIQQDVPPQNKG